METNYRWKLRSLLGYIPIGLYFGVFSMVIDVMVLSVFKNPPFTFIQGLFGYIKTSPEGLEYQRWPFSKNQFKWENVESITQGVINAQTPFYRGALKYGSLLIRRNKPRWEIKTGGGTLGSAKYHIIPISEFQGWDEDSLVTNLRLYAPHLSTE